MLKAIFYKEWIKTRWYLLVALLVLAGFSGFLMIRLNNVIGVKGVAHMWDVMLSRDAIFIDMLKYIPLGVGALMAIFQFMPEMHRKCLKLTLHLPYPNLMMVYAMVFYGFVALVLTFGVSYLILYAGFAPHFAPEMCGHVFLTALPWFLAGITAYFLLAWVCLEPSWKQRVLNLLVSAIVLRIYFMSDIPEAYNAFLPYLAVFSLLTASFVSISIHRFKIGKQD